MNPLVSVIIPTYKRPDTLVRAIESVLSQTYNPLEVIIVDDNPPLSDGRKDTENAMLQFSNTPNVKYIKHECNKGGSAARNTGWRSATGKYITYLDDDDEISQNRFEVLVSCLESLDDTWGACYSSFHILYENGTVQKSCTDQSGDVYIRALMRSLYIGGGSNLLLRKEVVDSINGFDESFKRNQDVEFMVRAFEHYKVAYVPQDMLTIHWEVRPNNYTFDFLDGVAQFYIDKMYDRISALSDKDKKRVLSVISLDRARIALYYKRYKTMIHILVSNKVSMYAIIKYIFYLLKRRITKKSYGFYL